MSDNIPAPPWWDLFFRDYWPEVAAGLKPATATNEEASFIRKTLRLEKGHKILDVPCGNGRLGIEIAGLGCDVAGIDLQPELVRIANEEAARRGVSFTGREGDMRDLPWFDEFDGVFSFWSSLGYFDEEGNREFLEAVWRTLKPGAALLIDTQSIETALTAFLEKDWFEVGGWTVMEERQFDCEASRIHGKWIFTRNGQVHRREVSLRMYTCRELMDLLRSCGFDGFEAYDTATGEPFSVGAAHLGLVARKKA